MQGLQAGMPRGRDRLLQRALILKIYRKEVQNVRVHVFRVLLKNGEEFVRAEWGKTRKSAARTLYGIYGDNIAALA